MDRREAYSAKINSKNGTQVQYVHDRLCGLADKMIVGFTGKILVEIPVLNGAMGLVSVTVTDRQQRDDE